MSERIRGKLRQCAIQIDVYFTLLYVYLTIVLIGIEAIILASAGFEEQATT